MTPTSSIRTHQVPSVTNCTKIESEILAYHDVLMTNPDRDPIWRWLFYFEGKTFSWTNLDCRFKQCEFIAWIVGRFDGKTVLGDLGIWMMIFHWKFKATLIPTDGWMRVFKYCLLVYLSSFGQLLQLGIQCLMEFSCGEL